jgi:choline-sulfatase
LVPEHVSLLDILPTLLDLAGVDRPAAADGRSLVPLLGGDRDPDRAIAGEYLAEGAIAPIIMIRRRELKFVWCDADPPQLYDLVADPDELVNLAGEAGHGAAELEKEVLARWDPVALRNAVVANQRARRTVYAALRRGRYTPWDYQPSVDSSQQYMRNHLNLNEVERSRRLRLTDDA